MFSLTCIPNKGLGLISNIPIPAGQLILQEPPILSVIAVDGKLSPKAGVDLERQYSRLSDDRRKEINNLANNYIGEECHIMGIFKTNAMVISNDKSCLFPLVCRANHACVPNCTYIWDDETSLQNLYACDNILAGDELTVSYLPDNMVEGRTRRRDMLRSLYRFDCICELCSIDSGIMFEQDERDREKAKMLIGLVNKTAETMDCALGGDVHKLMYSKTCQQLYKHLRSMRIHPTLEYLVLNCLFSISILLLDQEQAIQYAERASCLSKKLTGSTSSNTKDWELTCITIKDQFEDLEILQSAVNSWCFII